MDIAGPPALRLEIVGILLYIITLARHPGVSFRDEILRALLEIYEVFISNLLDMSQRDGSPLVGVIMGSKSDWETMRHAVETLGRFGVAHESRIVSAHRTPGLLAEYAGTAEERGLEVIIAGAGGAAHLPGMVAAQTIVPVLGVPVESQALRGQDSLLSIVQMPGGIPVGTLAIGRAGAINAALLAVAILANSRPELREALRRFREDQTAAVLADTLPG